MTGAPACQRTPFSLPDAPPPRPTCTALTSRSTSMERLGVRMRVSASSTACCTAVLTRVKEASLRPSRLVATLSVTLRSDTQVASYTGCAWSCGQPCSERRQLSTASSAALLVGNLLCHIPLHQLLLERGQRRLNVGPRQRLQSMSTWHPQPMQVREEQGGWAGCTTNREQAGRRHCSNHWVQHSTAPSRTHLCPHHVHPDRAHKGRQQAALLGGASRRSLLLQCQSACRSADQADSRAAANTVQDRQHSHAVSLPLTQAPRPSPPPPAHHTSPPPPHQSGCAG